MTTLLLIADGAAATFGSVATPALDHLPHRASLDTVPDGLPVASEVALPSLLGRWLCAAPARGTVEAAAIGRRLASHEAASRLDLANGSDEVTDDEAAHDRTAARLGSALGAEVHHLRRGRFLLLHPQRWSEQERRRALREAERVTGSSVRLWGGGPAPTWEPLDRSTVVVAAPTGAAAGVARLLGAEVVVPAGATGFADTDLTAKAHAAERLLAADDHDLVVVHVGAIDEAGHARDAHLQRHALTAFDQGLVRPLAATASASGIPLLATADHGTDPRTGRHLGGPVPAFASIPVSDGPSPAAIKQLVAAGGVSAGSAAG